MLFNVLHMYHVKLNNLVTDHNAFSNPTIHDVFCTDHKMAMMETGLYQRTFLCKFESYHHLFEHNTLILYTSVYLPILYIDLDQSTHFLHDALDRYFLNYWAKLKLDL